MPTEPPASALEAGREVGGRYRLVSPIARGGMAEVWEAQDTVLSRPVAVKVLLPHLAADDAFLARFRREAVAAARLSHPHIVGIYDTCATDDCEAIVMELVRGRTLREVLDAGTEVPLGRAVEIAAQVADALAHAHRNGLVHRDVKPGNILLADDGRVLVADFGIAKAAETAGDLTEIGQVVGTAKYLSPEQVRGQPLDGRSDVYSLGIVLYELLCGRPPFAGDDNTSTALARLSTDPLRPRQVRAGIPRAVEEVVLKAITREPEQRFASADDFRVALRSLDLRDDTTGLVTTIADPTPVPGLRTFASSERSWMVPAAVIVLIALTLGIVGVLIGRTEVGQDFFEDVTGGGDEPTALAIDATHSFDPEGNDEEENERTVGALVDDDSSTAWATDQYRGARPWGGLKSGVGVVFVLRSRAQVQRIAVESSVTGWKASVFVADDDTPAPSGRPVAELSDGDATADLGGVAAKSVLLWITDPGDDNRFEATEVRLASRLIS